MHEMYSPNICNRQEEQRIRARPISRSRRKRANPVAFFLVTAVVLLLAASTSGAALQPGEGSSVPQDCRKSGKNGECNEFGEIWMDSRADVEGERVDLRADIMLYDDFSERNTRWVMFSIRNISEELGHPVDIKLRAFNTEHGDVVTTREDYKAHRIDLWVDVLDLPVNTPIVIEMNVGVTERGAFDMETMVLAFDRGYEPIHMSGGKEASLFAYTTLSVTEATSGSGWMSRIQNVPGFEGMAVLGALAAAAVLIGRRRSK